MILRFSDIDGINTTKMKLLKKLFGINDEDFTLRFSKSASRWQVIKENNILYMGTKDECKVFINNMRF